MKTGKKNPLRILAGAAGALIVVGLLLLVDGITGDPISRRLADNGALAYAEKAYPGQTFTILESGGGQWFRYYARVQSEQSPDTTFTVHTAFWFFRQGEEQREVEGRNWTLVRQGKEGAAELSAALHQALPDLELNDTFNGWLPGNSERLNLDIIKNVPGNVFYRFVDDKGRSYRARLYSLDFTLLEQLPDDVERLWLEGDVFNHTFRVEIPMDWGETS